MVSTTAKHCLPLEINTGNYTYAMIFSANGEHLLSGDSKLSRVWRLKDCQQEANMEEATEVNCFAVSPNCRWISAGTLRGAVFLWDAETFETVWKRKEDSEEIHAVDFSTDSTRLVSASFSGIAVVWDIQTGRQIQTLPHEDYVIAAKFSPQGDRIGTATRLSVRVWDSSGGHLLVKVPVRVTSFYNNGLSWFDNHLYLVSENKIKQLDVDLGSMVSEWQVPNSDHNSCIAIPKHGKFIVYSTGRIVTFWDLLTHSQVGLIACPKDVYTIALCPRDNSLAIGGKDDTIIVGDLSRTTDSFPFCSLHPTFNEPDIQISHAALNTWKHGHIENADALLTAAIYDSQHPTHHLLAAHALVHARLHDCDAALVNAKKAIDMQPSVLAYIAQSVALIGKGETDKAYRTCDIAFEYLHSSDVTLLLLIKAIIVTMAGDYSDAISRMDDLPGSVQSNPANKMVQAYMYLLQGNTHMDCRNYESAVHSFEHAREFAFRYRNQLPLVVSLMSGWKFDDLHITVRQRLCEALYAAGRKKDACGALLELINIIDEEVYTNNLVTKWVTDFIQQYLSAPCIDDAVKAAARHTDMVTFHATLTLLLREWVKVQLAHHSWKDVLMSTTGFTLSRSTIYQVMCERLEILDCTTHACECFLEMLGERASQECEQARWAIEFRRRCIERLEKLGDMVMSKGQRDDAIYNYSAALSLCRAPPQGILMKRSKAYVTKGWWEEALSDATKMIELDPLSPWGYERKHAALHKAGDYENAIHAFEAMLSVMAQSPEPEIRALHSQYVKPEDTRRAIRETVRNVLRDSPRMLIDTISGRLCDESERAVSIESHSVFQMLISSTTTCLDEVSIRNDVAEFYRYAMFSHRWEGSEPLFEDVIRIVVDHLEDSHTNDKLKMFCKVVRNAGLRWAWSDTCCINKADHFLLQEALVSMFKWYQGSALTVVFLCDVYSPSRRGDMRRSIWNTRAWTFQEYHASKVVRFYTKDWMLYLNLDIPNHKDSPEVISEMEEVTGISAQTLIALRPGLDDIREKLCLASMRETTLVEDAAYSLLGIFSMSLPVVYGAGDQALGRLLAELLPSSGDTSVLAWTGKSGSFNSCLPASITAYKQLSPSHIPLVMTSTEMETAISNFRASLLNPTQVKKLYHNLNNLPLVTFSGRRMNLPCLRFKLGPLTGTHGAGGRVFQARADVLGIVEIRTEEDISEFGPLFLVCPWIDFLLGRQPERSTPKSIPEDNISEQSSSPSESRSTSPRNIPFPPTGIRTMRFTTPFKVTLGGQGVTPPEDTGTLLRAPSAVSQEDKLPLALQVIARLKQPFGALLLAREPGKVAAYRRVAAETLIRVQVEEITSEVLKKLVSSVRVLDVL